ncbi:MAG TPA: quinol oxidase [Nitrospirota bacterium]|nr:quinol oxidase [Nitrospirota bacterium]
MKYFKYSLLIILLLSSLMVNAKEIEEKRVVAAVDADGVQRVEVLGGEYFFDPNYIVVRMNIPVELIVKKESGLLPIPHNISIKAPEAGINFDEDMGTKPHTIKFTPTKAGKYPIICDKRFLYFFTKHDDKGMKGTLEVVP